MERSVVTWGSTSIPYEIRRSSRRGTVSIAVDPAGHVTLTAPTRTPVPRLDSLVRDKASWIVQRVKRKSDLPPPPSKEFVSGETFSYLGRQFRLRLLRGVPVRPLALHRGWLELPIPDGLGQVHEGSYARAALLDWYERLAAEHLPAMAPPWAERLGVTFKKVTVTEQEKRWGSCSNGNLRLNWRIVQAPKALVEYVVAHEVVHLRHDHHGSEFWAALGRLMPDYEMRRARLKELGPSLVW